MVRRKVCTHGRQIAWQIEYSFVDRGSLGAGVRIGKKYKLLCLVIKTEKTEKTEKTKKNEKRPLAL